MAKYQSKFELLINADSTGAKRVLSNLQNDLGKTGQKGKQASGIMASGWAKAGVAIVAATAAAMAMKRAMDFAIEGEKAKNVEIAFEQLSGTATNAIAKLKKASGGIIDETAVQSVSNRLSLMGASFQDVASVADLALKASLVSGRDYAMVLEQIATAAATGRTSTLAQLGIVVDAKTAYKDYADALGVTAKSLRKRRRRRQSLVLQSIPRHLIL